MIWIFFPPQHRFCLPSHVLLFFSIRTEFQYSKMGLLPLAVFNTERACFLIIFSSLRWHWFMRVMSDTPPSASTPSSTPPPSPPDLQFLRFSSSERSSSFLSWHIFPAFVDSPTLISHNLVMSSMVNTSLSQQFEHLYGPYDPLPPWTKPTMHPLTPSTQMFHIYTLNCKR